MPKSNNIIPEEIATEIRIPNILYEEDIKMIHYISEGDENNEEEYHQDNNIDYHLKCKICNEWFYLQNHWLHHTQITLRLCHNCFFVKWDLCCGCGDSIRKPTRLCSDCYDDEYGN